MARSVAMASGFGRRLKQLRERAGLTQEALARAAGLSSSSIAKIEQRDLDPSWSTVEALAKALGVNLDAFGSEASEPAEEAEPEPPAPKRKGKK